MLAAAGAYYSLTPDQKLDQESLREEFRRNAIWSQVMDQSRQQTKDVAAVFAKAAPESRPAVINVPVQISIDEQLANKHAELNLQTRLSTQRFLTGLTKTLMFVLTLAGLGLLGAAAYSHRQVQSIRRDIRQPL